MVDVNAAFRELIRDELAAAFEEHSARLRELLGAGRLRIEYITTQEAAEVARVSPKTVRGWVTDGHLTRYDTPGGDLRIDRAELDALLAAPKGDANNTRDEAADIADRILDGR